MANLNFKTALTGGTIACVDRNTAGMKVHGSLCIATISGSPNSAYTYLFDSSSIATADGLTVIIPYGQSAGTAGRWLLQGVSLSAITGMNRLINGDFRIAQRATSGIITAGTAVPTSSAGYQVADRWFAYSVGGNPTVAQIAGTGNVQNRYQITGAAGVTSIGIGQRIERNNSYDLAGTTCTLSIDIANSLLTSVTWTAYYANTADTFGTIAVPTKTQISTGSFTVTSTVTNYKATISVPVAATTGIEVIFSVGAQTSGTWTIGTARLDQGSVKSNFEYRDYGGELLLCQRYCFATFGGYSAQAASGSTVFTQILFQEMMRGIPSFLWSSGNGYYWQSSSNSQFTATGSILSMNQGNFMFAEVQISGFSGLTQGSSGTFRSHSTQLIFQSEIP